MKNCLILGSGRSGTSMVAGTLSNAGYFMGNHLIPGRDSNPKGFFEDVEINSINEALLAKVIPRRPRYIGKWFFRDRPENGQRWLSQLKLNTKISSSPEVIQRIQTVTHQEPFCFKDPRFCYTLPVWKPYLKNTVFVCIFRNPVSTAQSIMKEVQYDSHLRSFEINFSQALNIWVLMYRHILETHCQEGEWLFLHYEQVLTRAGLEKLAAFTGAAVDYSFPDSALRRSPKAQTIPPKTQAVYQKLCELAEYTEPALV